MANVYVGDTATTITIAMGTDVERNDRSGKRLQAGYDHGRGMGGNGIDDEYRGDRRRDHAQV